MLVLGSYTLLHLYCTGGRLLREEEVVHGCFFDHDHIARFGDGLLTRASSGRVSLYEIPWLTTLCFPRQAIQQ